jgi:hypothetical protein
MGRGGKRQEISGIFCMYRELGCTVSTCHGFPYFSFSPISMYNSVYSAGYNKCHVIKILGGRERKEERELSRLLQ